MIVRYAADKENYTRKEGDSMYVIPCIWTKEKPKQEGGLYLVQRKHQWVIAACRVKRGDWRQRQDPSRLYIDDEPIDDIDAAFLGPLPDPPNKYP